jgi:peptidoglycan/xylan/chitin deacetylase (PgdA/CDA1 family)
MGVERLLHSFDETLANLTRRLTNEQDSLVSFLFHGLFAGPEELTSGMLDPQQGITVDMFRRLVRHFKSQSYCFVSPCEILKGLHSGAKYILLTFDDGYFNNSLALPVLEEFDIPAVFFISTGHIREQKSFWWDAVYRQYLRKSWSLAELERCVAAYKRMKTHAVEAHLRETMGDTALRPISDLDRPFSPGELAEFSRHKNVYLGNHTRDHAILSNYPSAEIREQITSAQQDLKEMTGQDVCTVAYPNGNCSREIRQLARECGFRLGFGVKPGRNSLPLKIGSDQAMNLRRVILWGNRDIEQQCRVSRSTLSLYRVLRVMKSSVYPN